MKRITRLICILFGGILITLTAILGLLRDRPPDAAWIIFRTEKATTQRTDLYRVLTDGSHLKKISTVKDGSAIIFSWERPGWISIDQRVHSERRLSLVHLTGHEQVLVEGELPSLLSDYYRRYYDAEHDTLYLIVTRADVSQLWILDMRSGEKSVVDMPITPSDYRGSFTNGGYVFWSDANSGGDFYRFQFGNPPTVTRLTTRGDILHTTPGIYQPDWVYFYASPIEPSVMASLYRIRPDGSDEQLVAERVLIATESLHFWSLDSDVLYYWSGDTDSPTLIRAKADGSDATPLPIASFGGWYQTWSPDHQWVYYRQWETEIPNYFAPSDFRRMNIETGASFLVLENKAIIQSYWTADGQWLVMLIQDEYEHNWLYRMRPDGSDFTQIGLEVRDFVYAIPQTQQLVFRMWASSTMGGDDVYRLHTLDLATFEIHPIYDDLPPLVIRSVLDTLPMPELDWQPLELLGMGTGVAGIGIIRRRWIRRP